MNEITRKQDSTDPNATGPYTFPNSQTQIQDHESSRVAASKSIAQSVPGYELIEEVGRGGMGIVWRARDLRFDREIAVKFLSERFKVESPAIQRFIQEAKITGQLQHPNIPAVHEIGTLSDGRPFLAMKLIRGRSLSQLLNNSERLNASAVFEQIAQAVGYAHAQGVIHRDLKPANVMVGAFGEVQVMDWGLAKVFTENVPPENRIQETVIRIDSSEQTQAGTAMGTIAFMPPEQARGELERLAPPSDVFGLGAILCAILTGQPPYSSATGDSVFEMARKGHLQPAFSRLDASGAEPELIALCKRCLAVEPSDRPATGREVAEEVAALRASADARAKQAELDLSKAEVRAEELRLRRRVQLRLSGGILAVLLIGGAVAIWQDHVTGQARQEAEIEKRNIESNLRFFKDILSQASAQTQASTTGTVNPQLTVKEALDRTAKTIGTRFSDQPLREAGMRSTVGNIYYELGHYEEAVVHLEKALELHSKHNPNPDDPIIVGTVNDLGESYRNLPGRYAESKPLLLKALAGRRKLLGEHKDVYQTLNNLGLICQKLGQLDEAEAYFRQAIEGRERLLTRSAERTQRSISNLGQLLYLRERYQEAEPLLLESLAVRRALLSDRHPDVIDNMLTLGMLYWYWDRGDTAEKYYREGIPLVKTVHAGSWKEAEYRLNFAEFLLVRTKYEESEQELVAAFQALQKVEGIDAESRKNTLKYAAVLGDRLYNAWQQPDKAKGWQDRTKAVRQ